jgi:hypothetical protein
MTTNFIKSLKYDISQKIARWQSRCSVTTDRRTTKHDKSHTRLPQSFCKLPKPGHCIGTITTYITEMDPSKIWNIR